MPSISGITSRRKLDFRIVRDMACPTFRAEAYRSDADRRRRANQVVEESQAGEASKYCFIYNVPTLVDREVFAPTTEIGVDTDVPDYPLKEPATSVLSSHVPWSPHFKQGLPVCIGGEFWLPKQGHVTLGHLVEHLARLLNWDEKGRGPGYVGWNAAAVAHHRTRYKGGPLNPNLVYPVLPDWLGGGSAQPMQFEFVNMASATPSFRFTG